MDDSTTLEYMIWADDAIISMIEELSNDEHLREPAVRMGSLHNILKHIAEEYMAWLHDLKQISFRDEYKRLQELNTIDLISEIRKSHTAWQLYLSETTNTDYTIDEGDDLTVKITLEDVIYNLANHASYHRGQLVKILRSLDKEVPITDYYWYIIHLQKQNK